MREHFLSFFSSFWQRRYECPGSKNPHKCVSNNEQNVAVREVKHLGWTKHQNCYYVQTHCQYHDLSRKPFRFRAPAWPFLARVLIFWRGFFVVFSCGGAPPCGVPAVRRRRVRCGIEWGEAPRSRFDETPPGAEEQSPVDTALY